MSLNLVFTRKTPDRFKSFVVPFPYQTATDVSKKVLNAKTTQEQVEIIRNDLSENYNIGVDWIEETINTIEQNLKNPDMVLGLT